jgi:hypothetical protein
MSNTISTAVGQQQLYNNFVLQGFVDVLSPLMGFSTDLSPAAVEKGYTVNVSYFSGSAAPSQFVEGTGYANQTSTQTAKAVSLSNHYFVSNALSDAEMANSSLVRIEDRGIQLGAELASYVFQNVISNITATNHGNNVYSTTSSSAYRVSDIIAVRKLASNLKWGEQGRNIIINPNVAYGLLQDAYYKYDARGDGSTTVTGNLPTTFGFNMNESTAYPTNITSGSLKQVGIAANSNALLFASRYLAPGDEGKTLIDAYPLTDPNGSGLTIGYRKWYNPVLGTVQSVFECVWGSGVGNPAAAINLYASVDS